MSDLSVIPHDHPWATEYAGQWIAVKDGRVIAHSPNSADVFRALRQEGIRAAVIQKIA